MGRAVRLIEENKAIDRDLMATPPLILRDDGAASMVLAAAAQWSR